MIKRREFLAGLFVAPAIVHSGNLMKIWVPKEIEETKIYQGARSGGKSNVIIGYSYGFSLVETLEIETNFARINPGKVLHLLPSPHALGRYVTLK